MTDGSFAYFTTIRAGTKRAGLTSGYATNLVELKCTPLTPVNAETINRLSLKTPHTVSETFFQGNPDIKKGDLLVVDSVEYPIKAVEQWPWQMTDTRLRVIVEDLRS